MDNFIPYNLSLAVLILRTANLTQDETASILRIRKQRIVEIEKLFKEMPYNNAEYLCQDNSLLEEARSIIEKSDEIDIKFAVKVGTITGQSILRRFREDYIDKKEKKSGSDFPETPHKTQVREAACALNGQIVFPFIGDRIMKELTANVGPAQERVKKNWFPDNTLYKGLQSHFQTGGYANLLADIEIFDEEDAKNLKMCQDFIARVKVDVEKKSGILIPDTDNGRTGIIIDFVKTICADAIDRAGGGNHYLQFPYKIQDWYLKFGGYQIYRGTEGQDLKPYEDLHREMREESSRSEQAQGIANQIKRINEILASIGKQIDEFIHLGVCPSNA